MRVNARSRVRGVEKCGCDQYGADSDQQRDHSRAIGSTFVGSRIGRAEPELTDGDSEEDRADQKRNAATWVAKRKSLARVDELDQRNDRAKIRGNRDQSCEEMAHARHPSEWRAKDHVGESPDGSARGCNGDGNAGPAHAGPVAAWDRDDEKDGGPQSGDRRETERAQPNGGESLSERWLPNFMRVAHESVGAA